MDSPPEAQRGKKKHNGTKQAQNESTGEEKKLHPSLS